MSRRLEQLLFYVAVFVASFSTIFHRPYSFEEFMSWLKQFNLTN